ncbi:unnamed protein product [Peronospora effusa]|nr:unnamed protein product [Peronospora effusa]
MDHIPSLPKSHKGNTELLISVDLFTGNVMAKASASRTAQTVAEEYEECVFRRFGASETIRHDREPGFMSDFFRALSRMVGQRQRATMAYQPQANGTAERMVQTPTRSLKMYVVDVGQRDWHECAERLAFALNTAQDREGYAKKLAHLWHGPFRVRELVGDHAVRLELGGTEYRLFPIVYIYKLKPVREFPDRPSSELKVDGTDRVDFDECLLPEDSWVRELEEGEYEVEEILESRTGMKLGMNGKNENSSCNGRDTLTPRG